MNTRDKHEPDINLFRAIEVFMAVAEMRQVTAAASALRITQSAASQHLKNLEVIFGMPLFDRATRPITLTYAGEMLQRHGFRLLNLIDDLKRDMQHLGASSLPALRVGLLASIATTLTPGLYELVGKQMKVPELILSAGLATDHFAALNDRRIEMAVTSEKLQEGLGYNFTSILEEPFFLVLPSGYDGPVDDIHKIARHLSLARFGTSTPVGRRTDQHLQRCRLDLPRAIEADRTSMVMAGVITGKCFAILSPTLLIDGVAEGMRLRIEPLPFAPLKRTIRLVCRREDLGDIPHRIARECQIILRRAFETLFPAIAGQVVYHEIANSSH
ncbi:LysR family transcriptional regulator [Pseudogemmobacter humi]|uniref:HTH-type transcriptional regulator CynR n=1 Tax=Pseudogemmobacter humi TaxID=2483812 RepID=A0A3P5WUY1_9RHOB|nr:LysR family transcriptional regulator [Pseudogemmobacter humi]VDC25172.1 HTH-type transcriptional regulator CynR [Pseudogemmobacter humi]